MLLRRLPLLLALLFAALPLRAQDTTYQTPPSALAALVDAPPTPDVRLGPDRTRMLLLHRPGLPGIAELAEPELRLAGLRINPANNGPSRARSANALSLQPLEGGAEVREVTGLPEDARIRNEAWSPDGRHVAFTLDRPDRIDLFVLDVQTAEARQLTDRAVNDAFGSSPFRWVDSATVVLRAVPEDRGAAPEEQRVPEGPTVQENRGAEAPARTYQDLLEDAHDEALFEHYFESELVKVGLDGQTEGLDLRGLVANAAPSPDGRYLLVERVHRPFSYLVPAYRFPNRITVHAADGALVREVADLPLAEDVPLGFGSVPTGVRSIGWRDDAPAALHWAEAQDEGDIQAEADVRDQLFLLEAPFEDDPVAFATLPLRYSGVWWSEGAFAIVQEYLWQDRTRRVYVVRPDEPDAEPELLFDVSFEDRYNDPGYPVTVPNAYGRDVVAVADEGGSVFLTGQGASPEGNRPFLRKLDLETGETEELFRSEAPYYERVVETVNLAEREVLTLRESPTERPNYYLRDLDGGEAVQVTAFPHPYPELADVQKETVQYERADGVPLTATLYLPPGYDAERDGPLPTLVWAYPREFKSADAAGQRTDSPYQFTWVSYWGAVPFVTRGYAVLDDAAMPVVGEGEEEPNDAFREQLIAGAEAAIQEGVRRGAVDPERVAIGGHSYGAFMTANLLAHSDLFRAGIARSGAYNRTLTPFGFQAEERTLWEAPEVYFAMSPFMHAEKVEAPLLMIHGDADNNSGTFPMQSERYFNALKGMGKTARLVMLPHESHGYRARESVLHMLWEQDRWLEEHVKAAAPRETAAPAEAETEVGG